MPQYTRAIREVYFNIPFSKGVDRYDVDVYEINEAFASQVCE